LDSGLTDLLRGALPVPAVLGMAKDVDEDTLWLWLSGFSARLARERVLGRAPAASLARLQQRADRNRRLVRTSVRGDLLLRDWLIEWTREGRPGQG